MIALEVYGETGLLLVVVGIRLIVLWTWAYGENALRGGLSKGPTPIFASFGENHGKLRTARSISETEDRTTS